MAKFFYVAKDRTSRRQQGIVESLSRETAISELQQRGLFVLSISSLEREEPVEVGKAHTFSHNGVRGSDLALFARQLAVLLSSGVNLLRSLEITSAQTESRRFYFILKSVAKKVESGFSFTEAIKSYPNIFGYVWEGLIETGEASGNLGDILNKLADYLELKMGFMSKVISALIYPAILLVAGTGAVFFFSLIIIPKFESIFKQFDITLPFLTQLLFNFSNFMRNNFFWVIVLGAGLVYAVWHFFFKTDVGRNITDRAKLHMPILQKFFRIFYLERFSSILSILLDSSVPLAYSLNISQRSIGNKEIASLIQTVGDKVKGGSSMSEELKKSGFFPPMIVEMVKVGEEVGNLPDMFARIAEHYKKSFETILERFISLFEPLMIVFMGIIIGAVVISLFIPLFQLSTLGS